MPPRAGRPGRRAAGGLLTNLLNPKVAVFFVAFLPQFVPVGTSPVRSTAVLAAVFVVMTAAYLLVVVTAVSLAAAVLARPAVRRAWTGSPGPRWSPSAYAWRQPSADGGAPWRGRPKGSGKFLRIAPACSGRPRTPDQYRGRPPVTRTARTRPVTYTHRQVAYANRYRARRRTVFKGAGSAVTGSEFQEQTSDAGRQACAIRPTARPTESGQTRFIDRLRVDKALSGCGFGEPALRHDVRKRMRCMQCATPCAASSWRKIFTMLNGPAVDGRLLEIGVLDLDGDDPVVRHAMTLRPKFRRFSDEEMITMARHTDEEIQGACRQAVRAAGRRPRPGRCRGAQHR